MPATMVLVIGIIMGAFISMVLIVIIVLKMRTRVDGNLGKCDGDVHHSHPPPHPVHHQNAVGCPPPGAPSANAAPRYQFAAAALQNDYGDLGRPTQAQVRRRPAKLSHFRSFPNKLSIHYFLLQVTATTSLMEHLPPPPPSQQQQQQMRNAVMAAAAAAAVDNGFYNNNCNAAANGNHGERSRLFDKGQVTNSSKPVREWYV
jgi:hypothetical protein